MREETGFIPVDGYRVWYRRVGSGPGLPLLLLHGGPGAGHDYLEPLQSLARDGVQGVALGCTELACLAPACRAAGLAVAESNDALAAAALRLIQPNESNRQGPSCKPT